jgi:putative DNA primase/helicase
MCLVCNKLPRISSEETAIWNRLLVLPYESRFPKNNNDVPKTFAEQLAKKTFYRDPMLSEKLSTMKEAFVWLMFKTYKECVTNGWSPIPDKVKNASQKYRENNDLYLQFINECSKRDPEASVTLNEVYENFKSWVQQTFNNKPQSKNELRDELTRRWGPMLVAGQKWIGYRMRTALDDEQDGKILVIREDDASTTDNEADEEEDF